MESIFWLIRFTAKRGGTKRILSQGGTQKVMAGGRANGCPCVGPSEKNRGVSRIPESNDCRAACVLRAQGKQKRPSQERTFSRALEPGW